jgi:serine/threonine protein kinase
MKDIHSATIAGGSKLLLVKGKGWRDSYLKTIVLPFINGDVPPDSSKIASSHAADCWIVPAGNISVFVKFFHFRHFTDRFHIVRKTRARRAWEGSILLEKSGFHTPELIAQVDVIKNLQIQKNFLITEYITPSLRVTEHIKTLAKKEPSSEDLTRKRNFLTALGRLIGRLHNAGIYHGDLRSGNILMKHPDNAPLFYFIDNERNRYFSKGIPSRLREKNLTQINMIVTPQLTFSDRLRFFEAYIAENPELKPVTKDWVRRVFIKTRLRLRKKHPAIWESRKRTKIKKDV